MNRKWKIYLIHHSHTDIGYTERQDKISRYHSDFICQAIDILNEIHSGKNEKAKGFVWQCENFWQVRNFYANATEAYKADFERYVKTGEIGLSGNYLNLTELVSEEVLKSRIALAKEYGRQMGVPVDSAMCADINGMAWGYADALYENDVKHLYTCIHTHHGMFPLYKKVLPFYWESPKGNKVLVWNGDYYHLGNELFFAPRAGNSYQIRDEYGEELAAHTILKKDEADTENKEWEICETRLERYLANLEEEGYPVSFVPFMVSGCITDNAPPSAELAKRVNQLNEKYQGKVTFEMVNLTQFFAVVEKEYQDIPCYKGDFNDWWADGIGSTPSAVMVYLDARRKNHLCRKLDAAGGDKDLLEETEENLILYAEHTWGYSSSVDEPWEPLVGNLEWKKACYAVNANTAASKNLDLLLEKRGEVSISQKKGQRYRIINPHQVAVKAPAYLYIEYWEYVDHIRYTHDMPIEVIDCATGAVIPSQVTPIARAYQVEILAELAPGEEKTVQIVLVKDRKPVTTLNHAHIGAEGICDLLDETDRKDISCVETKGYVVRFHQKEGICSIWDKKENRELLRQDRIAAPFTGIYEVTDAKGDMHGVRREMGRNRKSAATERYQSVLKNIAVTERGAVYTALRLEYSLKGCGMYQIYLKIYEDINRIEARVQLHKDSVWNPENLYVALPFTAGEDVVTWVDKTGCVLRPGIDQLPGTNQEFYLIQNGVVWEGEKGGVSVAIKNAPLVTLGELEAGPIRLCNGADEKKNRGEVYSWVMNNFWETNFKAETGGFYEYTYVLTSTENKDVQKAFLHCEAENEGLLSFYVKAE